MTAPPLGDGATVVELRQYTLKPGRRADLVEVFDRELVHTQEEVGLAVLGQFTDLDRPDRFVWLRGFVDVPSRAPALAAFYGGPAWAAHGPTANDTMLEWHDVLLLRPVHGLPLVPGSGPLTLTVHPAGTAVASDDLLTLETLHAPNDYPALPVRDDVDVVVRLRRGGPPPETALQTIRLDPTPASRLR